MDALGRFFGIGFGMGLFFEHYLVWLILIPVLASVVILVAYSYIEYQKEKH